MVRGNELTWFTDHLYRPRDWLYHILRSHTETFTDHLQTTSPFLPTTYRPPLPTTYQPHTYHIPTTYKPLIPIAFTNHITTRSTRSLLLTRTKDRTKDRLSFNETIGQLQYRHKAQDPLWYEQTNLCLCLSAENYNVCKSAAWHCS